VILSDLLWIALLIIAATMLIYWLLPRILPQEWLQHETPPEQSSALEILRRRYARGEIDAMTFEQMRERLEASYRQDYSQSSGTWTQEQYSRWRVKD
jgi:uncharacterized membrane protein